MLVLFLGTKKGGLIHRERDMKPSLADRLTQEARRLKELADTLKPGPERDVILRKIRRCDVAAHLDEWMSSPGLQSPK